MTPTNNALKRYAAIVSMCSTFMWLLVRIAHLAVMTAMVTMVTAVMTAVMTAAAAIAELTGKDWFLSRFAHTRKPTERPEDENQQAHHTPRHTTHLIGNDMVTLTLWPLLDRCLLDVNYLPLLHLTLLHLPLLHLPLLHLSLGVVNWLTLLYRLGLGILTLLLHRLTLLLHRLTLLHGLLLRYGLRRALVSRVSRAFVIRMTLYRAPRVVECLGRSWIGVVVICNICVRVMSARG